MAGSDYERFHALVKPWEGIFESDAVQLAISQGLWFWSDPSFTTGLFQLLYQTFLETRTWLRGKVYLEAILANSDKCIDSDLVDIARDLIAGRPPENDAWYGGASYQNSWPAHPKQYVEYWNGQMFLLTLERLHNRSLHRSLKRKTRKPRLKPIRTHENLTPNDVVFMDESTGQWMRRVDGRVRAATEAEFSDALARRRLM